MLKKIKAVQFAFLGMLLFSSSVYGQEKSKEKACSTNYSYIVFDEKTDNILFEKKADQILYPASLVKVMTLYLTFEALEKGEIKEDEMLVFSLYGEEVSEVNKVNSFHAKEGEKLMVKDAIHAVIVKSFNEAAVVLAEAVAGDEWHFVRKMNAKAKELGMINTSFRNASGLHEEGQYTTAYDLARLANAITKDFPKYYHLFALKHFSYRGTKYDSHNHVLMEYKGAEGMKTGFTKASGFNLISSAGKKDERVISVLMGCASFKKRDSLMKNLLDDAFEKMARKSHDGFEMKLSKGFNFGKAKS